MQLLSCQFGGGEGLEQFVFFDVLRVLSYEVDCLLVVELHDDGAELLEDGEAESEDGDFLEEDQMVPKLVGCLDGKSSTEESEEPFYEVDL